MYDINVSCSISHFSIVKTSYKTDSRPGGQKSEDREHNLIIALISLVCFYLMFFL